MHANCFALRKYLLLQSDKTGVHFKPGLKMNHAYKCYHENVIYCCRYQCVHGNT